MLLCFFLRSLPPKPEKAEIRYAEAGFPVISNAGFHRHTADVPIIIAEINADQLAVISHQRQNRGWYRGFIVVKPNCSCKSYMIPLHALHTTFEVSSIIVATLQAISGAGYPGLSAKIDHTDILEPVQARNLSLTA